MQSPTQLLQYIKFLDLEKQIKEMSYKSEYFPTTIEGTTTHHIVYLLQGFQAYRWSVEVINSWKKCSVLDSRSI